MPSDARFDRHLGLFGQAGQDALGRLRVAVFGLGGLGSHVGQQLAHLGVGRLALVDHDRIERSNLNRVVGATEADAAAGVLKVAVAARLARSIRAAIHAEEVPARLPDAAALAAVARADVVVGAVDNDAARLALTVESARRRAPYLDLASDTGSDGGRPWYGGRAVWCEPGLRCLLCLGLLDQQEIARGSMDAAGRAVEARTYGVPESALAGTGPSVVSVNGVVASLGVTELMCWATGLRPPVPHLVYRGDLARVGRCEDPPAPVCAVCGR